MQGQFHPNFLGSLGGGVIVVIGFYAVIWGKAEESKASKGDHESNVESTGHEVPLLGDSIEQA